jgi:DNA-binding NtrC family response regulator
VNPLRERRQDIALLANWFLEELIREMPSARGSTFTTAAVEALLAYPWPGNVRQLRHVVASALVMKEGPVIRVEDLPLKAPSFNSESSSTLPPGATLEDIEARHIRASLDYHGWNVTRTAESLGVSRQGLRDRMKRFAISQE